MLPEKHSQAGRVDQSLLQGRPPVHTFTADVLDRRLGTVQEPKPRGADASRPVHVLEPDEEVLIEATDPRENAL